MTTHDLIVGLANEWRKRIGDTYPTSQVKWATDESTPDGFRRRVAVARTAIGSNLCAGFFVVLFKPGKDGKARGGATIEESSLFVPPLKAEELPTFVHRELFKALLADVKGVIGATFPNGTEIVKHYASDDDMKKDLQKL
jgi:hypothetical protein